MTMLPKPTREKDDDYLAFVKRRPCLVHECKGVDVDAHHVREKGKGGIGTKPSDRRTVPLCRKHHDFYHQQGRANFERDFAIILEYEIERLNKAYTRLPQPRRARSVQPKIRRIEVTCVCLRRSHKLAPSKLQGKTFRCPVTNQMVKVA